MVSTKIVLDTTFTDAGSLPVLEVDSILAAGSLLLIDPMHDAGLWPTGVPAASARVPNIAAAKAAAMIPTATELRPQWVLGSSQTAANSVFERTTKGGLHGIISQVSTGANKGAHLSIPADILAFLRTNTTHHIYVSLWSDVTRISGDVSDTTTPWLSGAAVTGALTGSYAYLMRSRTTRPLSTSTVPAEGLRPASGSGSDVLGLTLRNVGTGGKMGATDALYVGTVAQWGQVGLVSTTPTAANFPSFTFYRFYMEDLTVSGRTYATVDSIDSGLYTAALVTSGGRYQGDTHSAVSTLP